GIDQAGLPINYDKAQLNIVHWYQDTGDVPPVEFFIDDVSLKPVLKTQESGGLNDRDCRLYPKVDAPYCEYTDENSTTYKGWQGYCLERDPLHPKYCLNWWPVDLLRGESNVFSSLRSTGYAGRRPLYQCVETAGNYNSTDTFTDRLDVYGGGINTCTCGDCGGSPDQSLPASPLLNKVESYRRSLLGNGNYWTCNNGEKCNECGDIENWGFGIKDTWNGIMVGVDHNGGGEQGTGSQPINLDPQDLYYKWEIDKIAVIGEAYSHTNWDPTGVNTDHAKYNSSPNRAGAYGSKTTRATPDGRAYMVFTSEELDDPTFAASWDPNCWSQSWCTWSDCLTSNSNIFTVTFCFDPATQRLSSAGYNWWDTESGGAVASSIIFYLKEQCTQIAQVVTVDEDRAWFQRTDAGSAYEVPDLLYHYAQDFLPFGGVVQPAPDSSTPPDWSYVLRKGPLYAERRSVNDAKAGSAYSFTAPADSAGRLCSAFVTGVGYSTLNECQNQADMDKCFKGPDNTLNTADDGYCIGVGQGFCRADTSRFCTFDTRVVDCDGLSNTSCIVGGGGASGITTSAQGYERLRDLFAKSFGVWTWNAATGIYDVDAATQAIRNDDFKFMPLCTYSATKGQADRSLETFPADYCGVPPVIENILVGAGGLQTKTTSVIIPGGGTIQLTFDIKADPEQKPIVYIEVRWDDNTPSYVTVGKYDSGTVFVTHEYTEIGKFTPEIRVVDNWGWCAVKKDIECQTVDHPDCRDITVDNTVCDWVNTGIEINTSRL
ncbi:hypothetical protein IID19_05765, partial [Patescibacteria group bacterium]|nr:hypothetical protein [Patescibacteria group bacterium]